MNKAITGLILAGLLGGASAYTQRESIKEGNILIRSLPDNIGRKVEAPFAVFSGALTGISLVYIGLYSRRKYR